MAAFLRRLLLLPTAVLAITISHVERVHEERDTTLTPLPLSISPDQNWDGIDGAWSTFTLRVGTPSQFVRTLISFNSYQTWVVLPVGCSAASDQEACANDRGSLFDNETSSTFDYVGIYDLWIEHRLGLDGNAIYGYDTVGLGGEGEGGPTLKNTTVGALAVLDFYLGVFGVNPKPTNFTSFNDPSPSYMSLLYEQNLIPSISFGYTAGAQYRFTGVLASLTLGGYDTSKFVENNSTFIFAQDNERDLVVAIQSITTPSRIPSSPTATELLPSPIYAFIDSTVPQIWLPIDACRAFELEFGLTYDNDTQLYLVNDTLHQQLLDRDANVTFQLAQGFSGGPTVQIVLPYAAFNLQAQPPYQGLSNSSNYFPLQRAQNDSQYTLGRTFLQEAYISVDWSGGRFNVSQAAWVETPEKNLVTIVPDTSNGNSSSWFSTGTSNGASKRITGGAIAGIVLGAIAAIVIIGLFVMLYLRRKRTAKEKDIRNEKSESLSATAIPSRRQSAGHLYAKAELDGSGVPSVEHRRLLSGNISLAPTAPGTPTSGNPPFSPAYWMSVAGHSAPTTPSGGEGTHSSIQSVTVFSPLSEAPSEADSRERHVYEMPGDTPAIGEKDGKALSEKEAIAYREKLYNGVDSPPGSATAVNEGVREPRRVHPGDVVRADSNNSEASALRAPPSSLRRQFSFEQDSHQ